MTMISTRLRPRLLGSAVLGALAHRLPAAAARQPAPAFARWGDWTMAWAINDVGQIVVGDDTSSAILTLDGEIVDIEDMYYSVAINNRGQIVVDFPGGGYLWEDGQTIMLPMDTSDINDAGQVCGSYETGPAVVWASGELTELPIGPGDVASAALAINNAGQVVGYSGMRWGAGRPVLWDDREFIELPLPLAGDATPVAGGESSFGVATGISDAGHIVGLWDHVPVLWQDLEAIVLPMPTGATFCVRICGVNSAGQVAGTCAIGDARAVWWADGRARVLPLLPGDTTSEATGINEAGQVVGWSGIGVSARAVLWQDGEVIDLDALWRGA